MNAPFSNQLPRSIVQQLEAELEQAYQLRYLLIKLMAPQNTRIRSRYLRSLSGRTPDTWFEEFRLLYAQTEPIDKRLDRIIKFPGDIRSIEPPSFIVTDLDFDDKSANLLMWYGKEMEVSMDLVPLSQGIGVMTFGYPSPYLTKILEVFNELMGTIELLEKAIGGRASLTNAHADQIIRFSAMRQPSPAEPLDAEALRNTAAR